MTTPFTRGMAQATALTRSGKLHEATALIQSLLQPATPVQSAPGQVIDGDFVVHDPSPAKARPARRPLGDTLRDIAAGAMPTPHSSPGVTPQMPQGAQFLTLTHRSATGASRSYRLYIPANRSAGPMPLIVMLHGCTQTPDDFAAGTGMNIVAEEHGCLVAYPAQPTGANAQKCWNWFRPEDQRRGQGEPALIAGLTQDILRDHRGDPARTYVAGLSAGGAAAALVAAAYPDVFVAAGVHSGLPAGGAHDLPTAFAAMRSGTRANPHSSAVPTIVFHGTGDRTVHPDNGAAVLAQAVAAMPGLSVAATNGVSAGGRPFRTTTHTDRTGRSQAEFWQVEGAGHAWSGGSAAGSYTDAAGPDATRQMVRFFLQHRRP